MTVKEELFGIEEGFWLSGTKHFSDNLDDLCLLAFPQAGEMHGVFSREQVSATANPSNRWRNLSMSDRHLLLPNDNSAIISYKAKVTRADGEPYSAIVTSGYVRRDAGWKLIFHQHSPM